MRPVIRPVRPTAPPPPPTPPRRSSGIRHAVPNEEAGVPTTAFKEQVTVTAARHQRPNAPPLRAGNDDTPRRYEALPRYKDETATHERPRKDARYDGHHEDPLNVAYESLPSLERARPADEYEKQFSERTPNAPYGRNKLVTRDAYDDHDETSGERYALRKGARSDAYPSVEDSGPRRRLRQGPEPVTRHRPVDYEASYRSSLRESGVPFDSQSGRNREPGNARDDRSSPYASAQKIPAAPLVPQDMRVPSGFVMGVQPLRNSEPPPAGFTGTQRSGATPGNHMKVRTPVMGVPYGSPLPQPGIGFSSRAHAPPGQMRIRPASAGPRAHPVGHQLQVTELEEQQGSKVGRFAWFVFGAAFGIFFAFFATGFVGLGKKDDLAFPVPAEPSPEAQNAPATMPPTVMPAAPRPTPAQAAPVRTVAAPTPTPTATAAAPSAAPEQPNFAPQPAATAQPAPAPPPPVVATPQPAAAKQEAPASAAPAPRPQRATPPAPVPRGQRAPLMARRGGAAASSAPKAMPNSGSVDSEPSAPRTSTKENDVSNIGDLLSAGLAP